ncbi:MULTISPECIES: hypothetical protein [Cyanophyceae]|uniref:hypothetical protein n=1 Tax=Cyanophyceae TaxID=3028117 RepID=UPI001685199A|nr:MULTISPECIES: hypothetical protein [Cyanophyceae]MBD1916884.1 hypothetical protein [Phormidium sp. FACHB-77]MBD2029890.1 hypothetical protein [Phormidium sp. FACHB-322]MBD2053086.1 hypothetical protein [Leptolyngbya sp. FACHB-60]
MLTLRTVRQIATSRTIPSFRSAPSRSQSDRQGLVLRHQRLHPVDAYRIGHQQSRAKAEEVRRQWLQQQWQNRS